MPNEPEIPEIAETFSVRWVSATFEHALEIWTEIVAEVHSENRNEDRIRSLSAAFLDQLSLCNEIADCLLKSDPTVEAAYRKCVEKLLMLAPMDSRTV